MTKHNSSGWKTLVHSGKADHHHHYHRPHKSNYNSTHDSSTPMVGKVVHLSFGFTVHSRVLANDMTENFTM